VNIDADDPLVISHPVKAHSLTEPTWNMMNPGFLARVQLPGVLWFWREDPS
jgi:hypothetical protein